MRTEHAVGMPEFVIQFCHHIALSTGCTVRKYTSWYLTLGMDFDADHHGTCWYGI